MNNEALREILRRRGVIPRESSEAVQYRHDFKELGIEPPAEIDEAEERKPVEMIFVAFDGTVYSCLEFYLEYVRGLREH